MSDQRLSIRLINAQQAAPLLAEAWRWIKAMLIAGHALSVEVKKETRSTAQNRIMFARLTDISKQVVWHGQQLSPEDWKDMASAALKKQAVVPGLEGGFVVLGQRTSKMTKVEMTELIDFLGAFGDQRGVKWSQTSLGRDWPEEATT